MTFNASLRFWVHCKNRLWNLKAIIDFRLNSAFHFRPILHSFPTELLSLQRKNNSSPRQVAILHQKAAIFWVILSICSEFYQIGTPHFSLEGVPGWLLFSSKYSTPCGREKALRVSTVAGFHISVFQKRGSGATKLFRDCFFLDDTSYFSRFP